MSVAPDKFVLPTPVISKDLEKIPPPTTPSYLKHQVYDDPNVFDKVDSHAIRVAQNRYKSFKDLLWDLVYRYKLADLEKARVIFRWMTACNVDNLQFDHCENGSPEEVLLSLKSLRSSYAAVFEMMCSYSGLLCLTITGYAKGVDYKPGDVFPEGQFNHSWNVIYLQDSWQLVDPHWATRYLTSTKNAKDSIVYQYDDFYFIMEPQQAVYSHFPENSKWQLLERELSLDQFINLPLTKSQFFKCGMDFLKQQHGVVHTKDGTLTMTLGFWKPDSFTYKICAADNSNDTFNGIPLRYFVLQETANNKINFYFRFPRKDVFYLTIFAQELPEYNSSHESVFRAACEYKIIVDRAALNHTPYPMTCHDCNWGPQWSLMSHYGLTPQQEDGVISIPYNDPRVVVVANNNRGTPQVKLDLGFSKSREDVSLICKLRKNGLDNEDILDEYIEIQELEITSTEFIIQLPQPGEYGLEIYANEAAEGDTYTHVCQYLLDFEPPPGYKPAEQDVLGAKFNPQYVAPAALAPGKGVTRAPSTSIRDMYNYEKDAKPLGTLPQPYKPTQYSPEEATMIPGLQKSKPKPYAYQEQSNPSTYAKPDDSDNEMPNFPPPPPPPTAQANNTKPSQLPPPPSSQGNNFMGSYKPLSQDNTHPQYNNPQSKFPNSNYQPDSAKQPSAADQFTRPTVGQTNPPNNYKPYNQENINNNKSTNKDPNSFNIGKFEPGFSNNPSAADQFTRPTVGQTNPPTNYKPYNQENINNNKSANKDPNSFNIGKFEPGFSNNQSSDDMHAKPFDSQALYKAGSGKIYDPDLDKESIRLQPYLAHVGKGQSPHLSRKSNSSNPNITTGSGQNSKNHSGNVSPNLSRWDTGRDSSPYRTSQVSSNLPGYIKSQKSIDKEFSLPPPPPESSLNIDTNSQHQFPTDSAKSNHPNRKEFAELAGLRVVSDAFGKSESIVDKQPYLSKLETGNSPNLTKKSYTTATPTNNVYPKQSDSALTESKRDTSGTTPGNFNQNRNYPYSSDRNTYNEGENVNKDMNKPAPFRGYGRPNFSNNAISSNSNVNNNIPVNVVGKYQTPADTSTNQKTTPDYSSQFKENQAKFITPNQTSSLSNNRPGSGINDYSGGKVSNIAVNLTPKGFKKPDKIDITSDQYNKDYEGSRKIVPSPFQKYCPDESTANWTTGPVQKEPPKNFEVKPLESIAQDKPKIEALPSEAAVEVNITAEETSKIFQKVDEHAIQISSDHQESFNQLIWQLIYARNITDELEKVRVIFLWLCTKDLHKMTFDKSLKQDSPEEILMGIKNGKSTYAQVFQTLCRYAGVHSKLIVGYAKGADYVPGMKFQGRLGEHSWNAVLVDGVWRLIDCHWAARRLIGKEHIPENVRYELDMFYFLANPSQLVYTHFPHETEWQLLHHPVTIDEFESLAPVKSMFFKYNLDLITHKHAVIKNQSSPEIELRILFPRGVDERLLFTFTLTFEDGSENYRGIPLNRYGRQEIDFNNNHSVFWIRTPTAGNYKLLLYAKLINGTESAINNKSGDQKMFGAICEYKLQSTYQPSEIVPAFPPCQSSTYGPNEVFRRYPIEAELHCSSFMCESGTAQVKFRVLQPQVRVMAKLVANNYNTDQLTQQSIIQRQISHDSQSGTASAIITVFLPGSGEFGLEIYANEPQKDGNSFYTVWQYFVVSGRASPMSGPKLLQVGITPGSLGAFEPKFSQYGLAVVSHPDPLILLGPDQPRELTVELSTSRERPVRLMSRLISASGNQQLDNSTLQQQKQPSQNVQILIRIPRESDGCNFYKLQIFALPYSQQSESLPGVYNYLIQTNTEVDTRSLPSSFVGFPTQYAQWREGCFLSSPLDGVLNPKNHQNNTVFFNMQVPRCKELAVISPNETWTRLTQSTGGIWSGNVQFGPSEMSGELSVCANYGGLNSNSSFTTILRYQVEAS